MLVLEQFSLETVKYSIIDTSQSVYQGIKFAGILGLNPFAFMFIFLAVAFALMFIARLWWNQKQRNKAEAATLNKVLCEFCGEGFSKTVVCEVFKGQVKTVTEGTRATFGINQFISRKDNNLAGKGVMGEIDFYYWLPDHAFLVSYPEGRNPKQQIRIMKTHYYVNDPMPKITYRPRDWNPDVYDRTSSALAKSAQDEKVAQILVSELSGKFTILENIVGLLRRIPLIFYMQCAIVLLLVVNLYVGYVNMDGQSKIVKFLLGK